MEMQDKFYNKADYIETASGNKISRKSVLCGSGNTRLQGKTIIQSECVIRGDLANVEIGRQCLISERTVIRPPYKLLPKKDDEGQVTFAFIPLKIGDSVVIEEDCIINAASIGSFTHIGKNCVIGRRCILKDCSKIADNTVLAPDTVVPPFSEFSGNPGRMTAELPECTKELHKDLARSHYLHFIARAPAPAP
eukprot:m.340547 g.340547  ORF g.340547 m.340547 type:complete len:193 (-) comp19364_c0_seq1:44-622(-)